MSQNSTPDPNDADKLREWTNKQIENYRDSSSRADNNLVKDVAKGVASELGRIALGVVTLGLSEESRDKD